MNVTTQKYTGYSIGGDAVYDEISAVVSKYGNKIVILGGKTALEKALPAIKASIDKARKNGYDLQILDAIVYGKECTFENSSELAKLPQVENADVLFAVGGGKAIDSVKVVSGHNKKPYFTFPTLASTCAAYTEVAAVYNDKHEFLEAYYCGSPAVHAFINSQIIVEAPPQFIWAGMGDTLAKYYESNFSIRNREVPYSVMAGAHYSGMCVEPIIKYGAQAYISAKEHRLSAAFEAVVQSIIVGTGLAAVMLPEDYNSSLAHAICYGLTTYPKIADTALHGEMVAYGILVLLMMDEQYSELEKMLKLYAAIELPTKLKHFGLSLDECDSLLNKAVSTRDTKVSPYKIDTKMIYEALVKLEQL